MEAPSRWRHRSHIDRAASLALFLGVATALIVTALGATPRHELGWADIVEERAEVNTEAEPRIPRKYHQRMERQVNVEAQDRDRKAYINGWEIDTRYYPSIDSHTATPFTWARTDLDKRNLPDGVEQSEEQGAAAEDESNSCVIALIQVRPPLSAKKVNEIQDYLGVSLGDYHAHNTYVLVAPISVVQQARNAPHVMWVGWMLPELKIAEGLQSYVSARKRGKSADEQLSGVEQVRAGSTKRLDSPPITLVAYLVPQQRTEDAMANLAKQWQAELMNDYDIHAKLQQIPMVQEDVPSRYNERLRVEVLPNKLADTVQWLTRRIEVDRTREYKTLNRWAAIVVQSNATSPKDRRPTPLWDYGLSGRDQIIGISDTGIDTTNCLFYDPVNPIGASHRKVVAYMGTNGASTNDRDNLHGHGTHVAGSAAGSVTCGTEDCGAANSTEEARRRWQVNDFQGVAYNARISFMDLSDSTGCPADEGSLTGVDSSNLQSLYNTGARILSNSWGCSSADPDDCRVYDISLTLPLDNWAYTHPEALVVFAAGNEGSLGLGSVSSPGLGKNFLTVGASRNTFQSFEEAYNTFINYTFIREEYNRLECPADCSGTCCYRSESDCCNGIGTPPVVYRPCCPSYYRNQLKSASGWLIFSQDSVAPFSSLGPVTGGSTGQRFKPDIIAPGEVIISANGNCGETFACGAESSFRHDPSAVWWLQGTSMATPIVAGSVALVREYFMRGYYPSGLPNNDDSFTPRGALLKAVIINAGQDISGYYVNSSSNTYRRLKQDHPNSYINFIGHGRLSLDRVLYFRDYTPMYRYHRLFVYQSTNDATSLDTGDSVSFEFYNVGNRAPFSATLVWMDPAGASLANDLDITVAVDNNGTVTSYWGNHQFNDNTRDASNNVERVLLSRRSFTAIVNITVSVTATSISSGSPQAFALVVTCDEGGVLTSSGSMLQPRLWTMIMSLVSRLSSSLLSLSFC